MSRPAGVSLRRGWRRLALDQALLRNGEEVFRDAFSVRRHPRTGVGVSAWGPGGRFLPDAPTAGG